MRKNEHPRCGAASGYGKFVHRAINRKIRHATKVLLRTKGDDFEVVIISTPFTD